MPHVLLSSKHSLDALDPLLLLLGRGGRDAVHGVVALHHTPVCLCLAGLDHLVLVVRDVELKAVLGGRDLSEAAPSAKGKPRLGGKKQSHTSLAQPPSMAEGQTHCDCHLLQCPALDLHPATLIGKAVTALGPSQGAATPPSLSCPSQRGTEALPQTPEDIATALTGFFESSTSRMLRFSRGMMPRGSLSWCGQAEV